jgi:hypothetical protein
MSKERDLFDKHHFIQKSIELLASGAAWGSGHFYIPSLGFTPTVDHNLSDGVLKQLAMAMLVDGNVSVAGKLEHSKISVEVLRPDQPAPEGSASVEILRQTSSFDEPGQSILSGVRRLVDVSEKLFDQLQFDPSAIELAKRSLDSVHSALSVPGLLLDQSAINKAHPVSIKGALILYRGEVQNLRHNIRFGLSNLADEVELLSGEEIGGWWWNEDFIPQGGLRNICTNGPAYQVFSANGIDLHPVQNDELGALEMMRDSGFISNQSYNECRACYGL